MSNLLDKASIILTPTAYNNGEALCVKPSDGSGDFQFSRNSAATRVNAQGLVENVQILSSNLVQNGDFSEEGSEEVSNGSFSQEGVQLVTNGDFSNGSNWNIGTNWSIENGKATSLGSNFSASVYQSISSQTNKIYRVEIEVSDYVSGTLRVVNRGNFVELPQSNGVHIVYLNTSSSSDNFLYLEARPFIGSIDNVSVREVAQDWTLGTGWSIGEDKAVATSGSTSKLQQSISGLSGKTCKVSFTLSDYGGSGLALLDFGSTSGQSITANGTYTEIGTYDQNYFQIFKDTNFTGSITNISVKEVGQNWETDDANITIQDGYARFNNPNIYKRLTNTPTTNIVQGKIYKAKCTVTNYVSGACYFRMPFNNATGANRIEQNGEYEFISVADNNYSNIVIASATSNANMDITNISLIEITDDTSLPRINYEGFSYQDALGSEQIVNGTFDDGSNWTTLGGWSIGGGSANCNGGSIMYTNGGIEVSKTYKVTYTIINYVSGNVRSIFNGSTTDGNGTTRNANGTFTELVQSTDNASGTFSFGAVAGSFIGSIDNVSVKEYLGQEVVPDSGCGSWLFEPQSTNLLPYSEDFSQYSSGNTPIVTGGFLAPDGTNNAYKITDSGSSTLYLSGIPNLSSTDTRSIYARSVSGTGTATLMSYFGNTNNVFTLTEDWQRFEVNGTDAVAGEDNFYAADFRGSGTLNEYIIWGAQIEALSYATSYIPTPGSQVTRNQDLCTNGGSLASINSTEGVLYAEIAALADDGSFRLISLSDGTNNNTVKIGYRSNSNAIYFEVKSGGAGQAFYIYTTTDITDFSKVAVSYKLNDFSLWVDGVKRYNDTTGNTPIGLNTLSFNRGDLFQDFFGKTKALAVWKEALSDQELTELTTI